MASWRTPRTDYVAGSQVKPDIFNTLGENEIYLNNIKQNQTVVSTQATSRVNIGSSETVATAFGKIRKWLADLGSLAFKSTISNSDLESNSITQGKLATGAVTTGKIDGKAVTTIKLADGAVTDEKVSNVSASKITGLYKTYDIDYDWNGSYVDNLEEGIYLAFVIFWNRAGFPSCACCGTVAYSSTMENGCVSSSAPIYGNGEQLNCSVSINKWSGRPKVNIWVSEDELHAPDRVFDGDGGFRIILHKICNLPRIPASWNE